MQIAQRPIGGAKNELFFESHWLGFCSLAAVAPKSIILAVARDQSTGISMIDLEAAR